MNSWIIAWYTLKRTLKNLVVLVFFVAAPLLVVSLVGKSFENSASPAAITIGYHLAGTANEEQRRLSALFRDTDTGSISLRFRAVHTLEEGRRLLNTGRLDELVDLPSGARSKNTVTAHIYTRRRFPAARGLLERFADGLSEAAIVKAFQLNPAASAAVIKESNATTTGRAVSGLDAWACGGILIFLFYGSLIGSHTLIQDRSKRTALRIHSAPVRPWENIAGKSLGNVLAVSICGLVSVLASKYLFGAQWCALPVAMAVLFLFAAVANGFGLLLAKFSNNMIVCAMIAFAVNFFFGVLAITPNYVPTLHFSPFNAVSPHFYAQRAVINGICGGPASLTAASLGALALMAAVLYALVLAYGKELAQ